MKASSDKQTFDGELTAPIPISQLFAKRRRLSRHLPNGPAAATPLIAFISRFLNPIIVMTSLALFCLAYGEPFSGGYLILGILAFLTSLIVLGNVPLARARDESTVASRGRRLAANWAITAALVLLIAFVTGIWSEFSPALIYTWLVVTPFVMIAAQAGARRLLTSLVAFASQMKTALMVGANPLGVEFARRLNQDPYSPKVCGFFDDRALERLSSGVDKRRFLGKLVDLPDFLRMNPIDVVYISLPMVSKPRINKLLDELRDTAASVCFVPDLFAFDLMQARLAEVNGIPAVYIRESPFVGLDGAVKRGGDVLLSTLILLFIWPVLLAFALAVKLAFRGSVFCRQRSYALGTEEITIYKFRVRSFDAENSENDEPTTRFGRFLRKAGLDCLPQFINVLQGRMSLVGPELHSIAQAELYRKLIDGYILRYKIRPGITGWAQVNGFRGEAEYVEKMRKRVEYDLEYMRNWSAALDLEIIGRALLRSGASRANPRL